MALLFDGLPTTLTIGTGGMTYEIEVTPPPIDGGEGIGQDHMRSGILALMWPRKRRRLMPITALVSWNTTIYAQAATAFNTLPTANPETVVNKNQQMYLTFPDAAVLGFYGYVQKFEPGAMKEGERPTATITIVPTLLHPCTGAITLPTFTAGSASYC